MKKTINKRVYNTETATYVGMVREMHNCNVINLYLYKKRNGEYFLKVNGYSRTLYWNTDFMEFDEMDGYYYEGRESFQGEGIVVLREEDIKHYLNLINK